MAAAARKTANNMSERRERQKEKTMRIYIANLERYNAGELAGQWVELPTTREHLNNVLVEIGCGYIDHEDSLCLEYDYAIHDYECDIKGMTISEYESPFKLNELAEQIAAIATCDEDAFKTYIDITGEDVAEVIESRPWENRHFIHIGHVWNVERAAGHAIIDECYCGIEQLDEDTLIRFFDMEHFGRELQWDFDAITEDMDEEDRQELEDMSDVAFAEWYIEGLGSIKELGRRSLENYFDYEWYGRDVMYEYSYSEETGYLMSDC